MPKTTGSGPDRKRFRALRWGGYLLAAGGALAVLVGAALPWAKVTVFGVPLFWPGVAGWGVVTAALAVLTLSRLRNWPLLAAVAGIACMTIGWQSRQALGHTIARETLRVQGTLAPINDRLARVALPPIEPFAAFGPADSYLGPGLKWTIWGGIALTVGALLVFAGARLSRTCVACRMLWPEARLSALHFCPRCGAHADLVPLCGNCYRPLERGDKFCIACGTRAAP